MKMATRLLLRYIRTKFRMLSRVSKCKAAEAALKLFLSPRQRLRKKFPPVFDEAEKLRTQFRGLKVVGYRWGHPSDKKVLILHGWESGIVNFYRYVKPLLKNGYEVLGFDAPAHGYSEGRSINALDYRDFIVHLHEHYGPIKNYIGHSFGGLALALALEHMKHDGGFKAVMIAPATESTTAITNYFHLVRLDDEVQELFNQMIFNTHGKPASWYSAARAAENIKAQVLFLQDKDDEQTPYSDVVPIMKKNYPNFRFVISRGLGHKRIYTDEKSIETIIKFLD